MRSRTTITLRSVFQAAVLAACHEKTESNTPPPPLPLPTPSASASASAAAPSVPIRNLPAAQRGTGQRCTGTLVANLRPGKPVDSLELRLEILAPLHELVRTGNTGTACAHAVDGAKCQAAYDAAKPAGLNEGLIYTRGDFAGSVAGTEIAPFLAPIDTPEEAAMTLVYAMAADNGGVTPTCDPSAYHATADGYEVVDVVSMMCSESTSTTYVVARSGATRVVKQDHTPPSANCHHYVRGRRFEGMSEPQASGDALGAFFARDAALEAASVHAFRRLSAELAAHRAPRSLRARAKRAEQDEVRHARVMTRFAKRFGGKCKHVGAATASVRDLEAIAFENVVEGCVGETHAALIATFQAERAQDAAVRSAMRTIARDETRHAALAWDVATWIDKRLPSDARARVEHARLEAIARLRQVAGTPVDASLSEIAGMPTRDQAMALVQSAEDIFRVVGRWGRKTALSERADNLI